ncbi:hypothetical protein BD770DRAFT_331435, partial [Pilaira anomala]
LLFLLLSLANAATIQKRAISDTVQLCINDINAVGAKLDIVANAVNSFTSAAGYPGATAIHQLEQVLEVELKKAGVDCCVDTHTITLEEADAVLSTVSNLIPQITGTLGAIEVKKPQFDAILLATTIVKNDIKNLDTQTRTLNTCLINKTPLDPPSYLQTANSYASQINAAFVSAKSKYGVV